MKTENSTDVVFLSCGESGFLFLKKINAQIVFDTFFFLSVHLVYTRHCSHLLWLSVSMTTTVREMATGAQGKMEER